MSRLIVKNLPPSIKDAKVKEKFSQYGTITDIKLMYTKSGKFRRFAFVGYQLSEQAEAAKKDCNNSMLSNHRITVETCRDFSVTLEACRDFGTSEDKFPDTKHDSQNDVENSTNCVVSDAKQGSQIDKKATYCVKMRGCPFDVKTKQIVEFFYPLKPVEINIKKSSKGNTTGFVYVTFSSEKDQTDALQYSGDYINNRYIELFKLTEFENVKPSSVDYKKAWMDKIVTDHEDCEIEDISESGRLFVRNLAFACTEDDLTTLFEKFGPLSEVNIPLDNLTRKSVGFGFITYVMPEHALKAFNELDGTAFQGRMLHILPAKTKVESTANADSKFSYKKSKAAAEKKGSQSSHNWNALFVGTSAVADAIAEKYSADKSNVLDSTNKHTAAVRMALGETQIVSETREFLIESGISLDAFSQPNAERSKTVILAKNLPVGATCSELREKFEKYAQLGRVVMAPAGITAVIECLEPSEARMAFTKLAYRKFHHSPLYLEWAPVGTFVKPSVDKTSNATKTALTANSISNMTQDKKSEEINVEDSGKSSLTLFVKNLNFDTTDEVLRGHFVKCGPLLTSTISKKKTHRSNALLSMGYGFVTFQNQNDGQKALKTLQHSVLDGHKLELKLSERKQPLSGSSIKNRKKQAFKAQLSSKILVRNIPFQANLGEITSLFKSFGELKTVRLPKKLNAGLGEAGSHRGFGFVDFVTKQDAKNAFDALCHSTHLYGRRLVLEWADTESDSIESLRRKTSDNFHNEQKKRFRLNSVEETIAVAEVDSE